MIPVIFHYSGGLYLVILFIQPLESFTFSISNIFQINFAIEVVFLIHFLLTELLTEKSVSLNCIYIFKICILICILKQRYFEISFILTCFLNFVHFIFKIQCVSKWS